MRVKRKKINFPFGQWLIGMLLVIVTLIFSVLFVTETVVNRQADQLLQAKNVAITTYDLSHISSQQVFHGESAYFSFLGQTSTGQDLAVLVAQEDERTQGFFLNEGISREQAIRIAQEEENSVGDSIVFGLYQGKPIWEVKTGNSFVIIDFKTGRVTRTI